MKVWVFVALDVELGRGIAMRDEEDKKAILMENVEDHGEGMNVHLVDYNGRLCIKARNEGGFNWTAVDLVHVIEWVKANKPELLA